MATSTSQKLTDFTVVKMPDEVYETVGNVGATQLHVITNGDETNLEVYSKNKVEKLTENMLIGNPDEDEIIPTSGSVARILLATAEDGTVTFVDEVGNDVTDTVCNLISARAGTITACDQDLPVT